MKARDAAGMRAIDHAAEQSRISNRAAKAFIDFVLEMEVDDLNAPTLEIDEKGCGAGYTVMHRIASGVDANGVRPKLMRLLLQAKADMEVRTTQHPRNTAALIAAGQGCGETLRVLEEFGANLHAVNADGLGLLQNGKTCSSTIEGICWRNNVKMTWGKKTKRTEAQGPSLSRHLRYTTKWVEDTYAAQARHKPSKEGVQPRQYPFHKRADSETKHNAEQNWWSQSDSSRSGQYRFEWWSQSHSSRSGQYTNASSVERKLHRDGVQPRPPWRDPCPAAPRDDDPWRYYKPPSWNQRECGYST